MEKKNFYKLLAANIKLTRQLKGITQEELAEKAGLSTTHIGRIENGKAEPKVHSYYKICAVLGIQIPSSLEQFKIQMDRDINE
ncbi:helix-turn-helix domain-containing protein [Niallia nealsonii]|uniref:XRE family transcriptional regulator n=1 Tax=Niallia nealsonii TaxID=115979 RepID=A0A2N0Z714_9BACI|nr:helix-turn-helix transcriptional regulator [Niallia nealsonii]PKG25274.1 XRE family transcriptional regulator [Niallia nealsonii]